MYLIPKPKEMKIEKEGKYIISGERPIIIPRFNQADFYSAKCLKEKINEMTGLNVAIEAHSKLSGFDSYILLLNLSNCGGKYENYSTGEYKKELKDEGYELEITNQKIVIVSLDDKGLFYGVQTLKQVLNNTKSKYLPLLKIHDYPDLPLRGVMLDISRNWTPTLETLKRLIYNLSEFKINHFQLYIEPHVFKSRRHPIISQGWGSITAEELMEIGEICEKSHIEFVPNLQSFGHFSRVLIHKEYEKLAEDPEVKDCLSPILSGTYDFLEELYSEFLPLFDSNFFNVGCDETFELRAGNGKSKELAGTIGTYGVYFGHIEKIRELAAAYGKQIMIWADEITIKKDENYLNEALKLPKDIVLINWWYDPEWDYDENEETLDKTGCKHMFCPGTSSWLRLYPENYRAKLNITNFTAAAIKHNTMGMLVSDWGDCGHTNLLGQSYYGFLFAANTAWNVKMEEDEYFERAYCLNYVGDKEYNFSKINDMLSKTYDVSRKDNEFRNALFDICFFDGLISDEYVNKKDNALLAWGNIDRDRRASDYIDSQRMEEVTRLLEDAFDIYKNISKDDWKQKILFDEIGYTIRQMIFACKKYQFIQKLKNEEYDTNKMIQDLRLLLEENDQLQRKFSEMWLETGHPEGKEMHMNRFDWVREDIQMVILSLSKKLKYNS